MTKLQEELYQRFSDVVNKPRTDHDEDFAQTLTVLAMEVFGIPSPPSTGRDDDPPIPMVLTEEASKIYDEHERDMLVQIFAKQRSIMDKYRPIEQKNGTRHPQTWHYGVITDRDVQEFIKRMVFATIQELCEATHILENNPWRESTQHEIDSAHYYEELADAFHFFVEVLIASGVSADDLHMFYMDKNAVNLRRMMEGR